MEFVERLGAYSGDERWLVQVDGELRVLWVHATRDTVWLDAVDRDAEPWLGFVHPRVSRLYGKTRDHTLTVIVDDDRGPTFADAAQLLADAPDRERWVVAQIIALADALAAMAAHHAGFVYGPIEDHRVFVDVAGHARLRAPVGVTPASYRSTRAGGLWGASWNSPETVAMKPRIPASDVFLLAGHLTHALTGREPFARDAGMQTLVAILQEDADPVQTSTPGLDAVIAHALVKDPAKRLATPAAFAAALRSVVPDAADYDAVISDRIAAAWPTAPLPFGKPFASQHCRMSWGELAPAGADIRDCTRCAQRVVRVGSDVVPFIYVRCDLET